jgi:hypothetical protein
MARLRRSLGRLVHNAAPLFVCAAWAHAAHADDAQNPDDTASLPVQSSIPPPVGNTFVQYGVAFTTEVVASAGQMCANGSTISQPASSAQTQIVPPADSGPCILGSGGGIVFPRIGWRAAGPWYVGGAYELSKQDANTIDRLPILQQLRGEARYYFLSGQILTPYVGGSAGLVGYGNEWSIDTFGPEGAATLGIEAQVSRDTVVGLAVNYRAMYFRPFTDSSNTRRDGSFAQLWGIDLQLEVREPY